MLSLPPADGSGARGEQEGYDALFMRLLEIALAGCRLPMCAAPCKGISFRARL